jgi:hypothetical protein
VLGLNDGCNPVQPLYLFLLLLQIYKLFLKGKRSRRLNLVISFLDIFQQSTLKEPRGIFKKHRLVTIKVNPKRVTGMNCYHLLSAMDVENEKIIKLNALLLREGNSHSVLDKRDELAESIHIIPFNITKIVKNPYPTVGVALVGLPKVALVFHNNSATNPKT